MKNIILYIKNNYLVELTLITGILCVVIIPPLLSPNAKFDYIEKLSVEKSVDDAEEYMIVVGKFSIHSSDRKQKNWVIQLKADGTVVKQYEQDRSDDSFADGQIHQNQYNGKIYLRMIGGMIPNYLWEYDEQTNTFAKRLFAFEDGKIGINAAQHYGNDAYVVTNASHITHKQNLESGGILQSVCSYQKQICAELNDETITYGFAGAQFANKTVLVARYRTDEEDEALELTLLNDELTKIKDKNIKSPHFLENFAKQFVFNNHVYFLSTTMTNKYAYQVDDQLNVKELKVTLDGINKHMRISDDNILHIKDNEFVAVGSSGADYYLLSLSVHDEEISIKKVGESVSKDAIFNLSHKSTKDNVIYALSKKKTAHAQDNYIFIYDATTLGLVKKIPIDAIHDDDVITFVDKIR